MLSLLMSGPKQPENDLVVYLAPLIDDSKTLWKVDVETDDAFKKQTFNLRVVLMWNISDFPTYKNLFRCIIKDYYVCRVYGLDKNS